MDIENNLIDIIKSAYPKLYITEVINNDIKFKPEDDLGYIEYKRTLADCTTVKTQKYATQMRWRISENVKNQFAIYYIGVDDDGSIIGLNDNEALECVKRFISIAESIKAAISGMQIIRTNNLIIMKINVKIKKNLDNYLIDFGDKF